MDSMFIEQKYLLLASSQLSQFKKKGDHLYNFRCPYCGDSQKSKLKARGFVFLKDNKFIYKCHNCSKGASLQNLLKYVDVKIYNDYIFERYKKTDNEPDIGKFTQPKFLKGDSPLRKLKKVSQLSWNHPVKQFVQKRKIPTNLHFELFFARKFYEWVNSIVPNKFQDLSNDHPRLVIPFFDEDNKMFAFQGRAFGKENPKYITIILDPTRDKIYGLNRLDKNNPIFAVEGPIDSLFLDNCVAVAGADFNKLPLDYTIIFDNERRNKEVLKQIEKTITKGYKVVLWPDDIKEKDINEMILSGMTKEDVKRIITKNTYQGNMALIKLTTWRKVDAE
jgi:transcription elongation factor Elf1